MKKSLIRGCWLLLVLLGVSGFLQPVSAKVPERPVDSTVVDRSAYLSHDTIERINHENKEWARTDQQVQVGVLILESLEGQDLEVLANETFRKWQIGYSETNNGILLLIAIEDRAFRLETSDQAATVLTDVVARRILDNSREFFREEAYDSGVLYIVDAIGDQFYGTNRAQTYLEEETHESSSDSGLVEVLLFVLFLIVFMTIRTKGGGRGGGGNGGSNLLWWLLMSGDSYSSSDDSHSGSFNDSGWSGGGGGGGGASSGW